MIHLILKPNPGIFIRHLDSPIVLSHSHSWYTGFFAHPREYISANGRSLTLAFQRALQASVHHGDLRTPIRCLLPLWIMLDLWHSRCRSSWVPVVIRSWGTFMIFFLGDDSILHSQKTNLEPEHGPLEELACYFSISRNFRHQTSLGPIVDVYSSGVWDHQRNLSHNSYPK